MVEVEQNEGELEAILCVELIGLAAAINKLLSQNNIVTRVVIRKNLRRTVGLMLRFPLASTSVVPRTCTADVSR